ncbi:MAG: aspartyl-tRNA(Asn)/glutamyl-tRNA(Gln) amidotransferase subunit [Actinomycetota bacterium]|jgi:aspartyl-tRNA(Asn)/glutamyl-tRNA(Gln) amidotransferase subunit A|nr:aspartyl-tRNA(Asn)/glutamyl-tRNA(Gln) amidotransferase subunit [Actinomycetota bacterium]
MPELEWASAHDLVELLEAGEVTSVDIVQALIERAEVVDPKLHAYLERTDERALSDARASDDRRKAGDLLSRFDGVPIAYKDLFITNGVVTTSGSRILEGFVPPYDSTVVARCAAAGMPMLGKTNMDEFAMGSSTENSGYGPTRNPWNLDCVPGGSSGGSTAVVAGGAAPWAWGTDTGGSIRQPASLCGLVGLKPTYGRVSRHGMIAFASSLDQAGPITRSVKDAAVLLQTVAGGDEFDSTCLKEPVPDYLEGIGDGIAGLRIGLVKEFEGSDGTQPGVTQRVREAYERLENLGAKIEEISLPSFEFGISAYYLIAPAEASSNLARYDGVRYGHRADGKDIVEMTSRTRDEGFGDEVKRRIMLGTYALSAGYYDAYYGKAQKVRTLITRDLERAYSQVDLIACPTSPTTAFKLGERTSDPLAMYLSDIFTVPFNLAGNTGISIPCGLSPDDDLPVGLQLSAKTLDEKTLFRAAYAFEQDFGFSERPAL